MNFLENLRNASIGLAIAVILPIMIHLGTRLIVPKPACSDDQACAEVLVKSEKTQFALSAIVSLVAIVAAGFLVQLPFLSMGLILGGTFTIVQNCTVHWSVVSNELKFLLLLVVFGLLIFLSYRFAKNSK